MMKKPMSFTIPATDHSKVRSGVRATRVIDHQKTRESLPRKAKHKKREDY